MTEPFLTSLVKHDILVERAYSTPPQRIIAGAMGGSAAAAHALAYLESRYDVSVHEGYDLPRNPPTDALYLAVSYSGNTEETLSFAQAALEAKLPLAVVTSGGALRALAQKANLPLAVIPTGVPPRDALPLLLRAELTLLGDTDQLTTLLSCALDEAALAAEAEQIAGGLATTTPILYASERNRLLGRIGKMYINESAKRPAFLSVIPERNHDELEGFTNARGAFSVISLRDATDDPRIIRRFDALTSLLSEVAVSTHSITLKGEPTARLLSGWFLLRHAARALAKENGAAPDTQPLVDAFKQKLA